MGKGRKAVITGATGFIGSHITRFFVSEGWKVHCILWVKQPDITPLQDIKNSITLHYYDQTAESLNEIVRKTGPDVVFHLASLFLANHNPQDVKPLVESNILLGTQLIEAMVSNGVYSLVNTGTSWQHYHNEEYNPVCLYAATKQAFESILKYYTESSPLKVVTLKLFDTYGPGDTRRKLFTLLRCAEEGNLFKMSPGNQLVDLVFIDDIVKAFSIAADRLLHGKVKKPETLAVSSGNPVSLKKVVQRYLEISGKKITIQWGGIPYRAREVMRPWRNGKKLPGWKPMVSLKEGIRRMKMVNELQESNRGENG